MTLVKELQVSWRHGIIVAASDRDVRSRLVSWFEGAGYEVTAAGSFSEARDVLGLGADLVVSELKLGEYNGLHLAAHARRTGIPAIVIGPHDIVIERDADQLGALYLSVIREQDLLALVAHELTAQQGEGAAASSDSHFVPVRRPMLGFPVPGRSTLSN
jgi:CheY-like chemotaxis protein